MMVWCLCMHAGRNHTISHTAVIFGRPNTDGKNWTLGHTIEAHEPTLSEHQPTDGLKRNKVFLPLNCTVLNYPGEFLSIVVQYCSLDNGDAGDMVVTEASMLAQMLRLNSSSSSLSPLFIHIGSSSNSSFYCCLNFHSSDLGVYKITIAC